MVMEILSIYMDINLILSGNNCLRKFKICQEMRRGYVNCTTSGSNNINYAATKNIVTSWIRLEDVLNVVEWVPNRDSDYVVF